MKTQAERLKLISHDKSLKVINLFKVDKFRVQNFRTFSNLCTVIFLKDYTLLLFIRFNLTTYYFKKKGCSMSSLSRQQDNYYLSQNNLVSTLSPPILAAAEV